MATHTTVSDYVKKDQLLATTKPTNLEGFAVAPSDVNKIFVLIRGLNNTSYARILTREELIVIAPEKISLWYPLAAVDVNIENI